MANESRVAFEASLPSEWVARRVDGSDDYGIDYEVEVFESGRSTGVAFKVQLKGTDDERAAARPVRVEYETLDYWNSLDVPVMVAHFSKPTADVRYRWVQAHDPYTDRQAGRSTTTIDTRDAPPLTPDAAARVLTELAFARALKRGERMPLPIPTRLDVSTVAPGRAGLIRNAFRRFVETGLMGVVVLVDEPMAAFEVRVTDDALVVSGPAGLQTLTLDVPRELRREIVPEVIAADCLAALAVSLCQAHNNDVGRRLLLSAARRSGIVVHPFIAEAAADCVVTTASPGLALAICDRLLSIAEVLPPEGFDFAFQVLMMGFFAVQSFATRAEYDHAIELWTEKGELHTRLGDRGAAARCTYNAATALAGKGEHEAALQLLKSDAMTFDGYQDRAYLHEQVAELCWTLGRYEQALLSYERAMAIEERDHGRSRSRVLLADALIRMGRLDEAQTVLADWTVDDDAHLNRLAETLHSVTNALRTFVPHPDGAAAADEATETAADTHPSSPAESLDAGQVIERLALPGRFLDMNLWERLTTLKPIDVGPAAVLAWLAHTSGPRWAWLAVVSHAAKQREAQVLAAIDSGLELDPAGFFATINQLAAIDERDYAEVMALVTQRSERADQHPAGPTVRIHGHDIRTPHPEPSNRPHKHLGAQARTTSPPSG